MAKKFVIGKLSAILSMNSARFTSGTKRAQKSLGSLRKSFIKMGSKVLGLAGKFVGFGLSIGAVAAGLTALAKRSLKSADAANQFAGRIGIGVNQLRALELGAKLSGVGIESMRMAMQRMVRRVNEAARGTGEARDTLKELGINAKAFAALAPEEQIKVWAERMMKIPTAGERVARTMKLMDSEGVAMVQMFHNGRLGIESFEKQFKELGGTLSRSGLQSMQRMMDSFTRLGEVLQNLGTQIGILVSPFLENLSNAMIGSATTAAKWRLEMAKTLKAIAHTAQWVAVPMEFVLKTAGAAAGGVMWGAGKVASGVGAMTGIDTISHGGAASQEAGQFLIGQLADKGLVTSTMGTYFDSRIMEAQQDILAAEYLKKHAKETANNTARNGPIPGTS